MILYLDVISPVLLMYTDGRPDHRVNYLSVKLVLITLFRELNLDLLIALRTAPSSSWANPVECIMSIVNIGLQAVGVMRSKMSDDFERVVCKFIQFKSLNSVTLSDESNILRTWTDYILLRK